MRKAKLIKKIILTAIFIVLIGIFLYPTFYKPFSNPKQYFGKGDFAPPYAAAQLMQKHDGTDLYSKAVTAQVRKLRPQEGGYRFLYPPSIGMLYIPFTWLKYYTATRVMIVINIILVFATFFLLYKVLRRKFNLKYWITVTIMTVFSFPIYKVIQSGQINYLILFLIILTLFLYLRKKELLAGMVFGLSCMIKFLPAVLLLYFFWRKKWKVLAGFLITFLFLTSISSAYGNLNMEKKYYTEILPKLSSEGIDSNITSYGNKTLYGFLLRNFTENKTYKAIAVLPDAVIKSIYYGVILILTGFGAYLIMRKKKRDETDYLLEIAFLLTYTLIVATSTHVQYLIFLFIPIILLLFKIKIHKWWSIALIILSIVIISADDTKIKSYKVLEKISGGGIVASSQIFALIIMVVLLIYFMFKYQAAEGIDDDGLFYRKQTAVR